MKIINRMVKINPYIGIVVERNRKVSDLCLSQVELRIFDWWYSTSKQTNKIIWNRLDQHFKKKIIAKPATYQSDEKFLAPEWPSIDPTFKFRFCYV